MIVRSAPHETEHRITTHAKAMCRKPPSLLRWLCDSYGMEAPAKLHSGATLEIDGDPAMTGEAAGWLGFHQGEDGSTVPNDWRRVACRVDADGKYKTPTRAALSRIADPKRRRFACELAVNLYFPLDVAEANGVSGPDWQVQAAIQATLELVWRTYADAPEPRSRGWSDAQANAEAAEPIVCAHRWEKVPASAYYVEQGYPTFRCRRCGTWSQEGETT